MILPDPARRRAWTATVLLAVALTVAGCTGDTLPMPSDQGGAGQTDASTATIERSDFQVTYRLEGVTRDSEQVQVLFNPQLSLDPTVRLGGTVASGQTLGTAVVGTELRAQLQQGGSHLDASRLAQLEAMGGTVTAPVDGVFTDRDATPVVVAKGIDVVVNLTPIQYLRYRSLRFTGHAVVQTVIGNRHVPCRAVWTETIVPDESGSSARLHCRLPGLVETAAGLRARVVLQSQLVADAIVVPNVYIGYDYDADSYFLTVRDADGERSIPILVGATDGVRRVVLSDVPLGAELLRPPGEQTVE